MSLFKKLNLFFPALCLLLSFLLLSLSGCGTEEASKMSSSGNTESQVSSNIESAASSAVKSTPSLVPTEESAAKSAATPSLPVASLRNGASFYAKPSPEEPFSYLEPGILISFSETKDPLWCSCTLENGSTGYLYAEALYRIHEDGTASSKNLFQETSERKLAELRERLPEGKYWNHMWQDIPYGEETPFLISDTPCEHSVYGELYCNFYNGKTEELFYNNTLCQCLGFASLLSDQLFGRDASLHVFYDIDLLRVGDHIRLHEYEHSMTVVEKSEDGVTVAEVNENYEDCLISWTRQISYYELEELAWDSEYISRYPFYPDGEDGFIPWEE